MRLIFLIFLLPIRLISQDLPAGYVNFGHRSVHGQSYFPKDFPKKGYDLYTSNKFTSENYYGYIDYYERRGKRQGAALRLHLKGDLTKPDSLMPSIGGVDIFTSHPENTIDTVYKADEQSFFTVTKKKGKKVQFMLNDNKCLWVKTEKYVRFVKTNDLLTKICICAYADSTINLYSKPDLRALIKSDARFSCFAIKEIINNWAHIETTEGDPCANYKNNGVNDAWIIWYDKKILINPLPW